MKTYSLRNHSLLATGSLAIAAMTTLAARGADSPAAAVAEIKVDAVEGAAADLSGTVSVKPYSVTLRRVPVQ